MTVRTPRYLSQTDVARLLGVSRTRVHQLLNTERLPEPDAFVGGRPAWLAENLAERISRARELLTPAAWQDRTGVRIMDPDGWRAADAPSINKPITRQEFLRRAFVCTATRWPDPLLDEVHIGGSGTSDG